MRKPVFVTNRMGGENIPAALSTSGPLWSVQPADDTRVASWRVVTGGDDEHGFRVLVDFRVSDWSTPDPARLATPMFVGVGAPPKVADGDVLVVGEDVGAGCFTARSGTNPLQELFYGGASELPFRSGRVGPHPVRTLPVDRWVDTPPSRVRASRAMREMVAQHARGRLPAGLPWWHRWEKVGWRWTAPGLGNPARLSSSLSGPELSLYVSADGLPSCSAEHASSSVTTPAGQPTHVMMWAGSHARTIRPGRWSGLVNSNHPASFLSVEVCDLWC